MQLGHAVEHDALPRLGALRVLVGREAHRTVDQAGQQGALPDVQVAGRLAEVEARRGLHPVAAVAEVGEVEVHEQDLVLGELLLQLARAKGLEDLAAQGLLAGGEHELGELLGDRAAALSHAQVPQVGEHGPGCRPVIDAAMAVEGPVLRGDQGLLEEVGQVLGATHVEGPLAGELPDEPAGGVEDAGGDGLDAELGGHVGDLEDLVAGEEVLLPVGDRDVEVVLVHLADDGALQAAVGPPAPEEHGRGDERPQEQEAEGGEEGAHGVVREARARPRRPPSRWCGPRPAGPRPPGRRTS